MAAEILARRYARALLNALPDPASTKTALAELKQFDSLLAANKDLRDALFHPVLPKAKKADLLRAIFQQIRPSPKVDAFCMAIVERGRIVLFPEIVKAVEKEWDRRERIVEVEIRSAILLKATQRAKLEAELTRLTGARIKPVYKLDSGIVAGVVTRIGTTFYDGSLKSQLRRIRESLIEA